MDQLVEDYLSGLSAYACSKKYDVDTHTVLDNIRKRGIGVRPLARATFSGDNLDRALELRAQGWSYQAIGNEFGVSNTTAIQATKRAGEPTTHPTSS